MAVVQCRLSAHNAPRGKETPDVPAALALRRHQILNLIAGRPGDRYEALRPFIAIDAIDDSERSLRNLINSTRRQLGIAEAGIGENLQTLENVCQQAGAPAPSMLAWAEAASKNYSGMMLRKNKDA